jgi:hypothetical protein
VPHARSVVFDRFWCQLETPIQQKERDREIEREKKERERERERIETQIYHDAAAKQPAALIEEGVTK